MISDPQTPATSMARCKATTLPKTRQRRPTACQGRARTAHGIAIVLLLFGLTAVTLRAADGKPEEIPPEVKTELMRILREGQAPDRVAAAMQFGHVRMRQPDAITVLASQLEHRSPEVRNACLFALGRTGVREVRDTIVKALNDPAPDVRTSACLALADLGAGAAKRLPFDDSSPAVRLAAAQAVAQLGWPTRLTTQLAARLKKEPASDIKAALVDAFTRQNVPLPTSLCRILLSTPGPELRLSLLRHLDTRANKTTIPAPIVDAVLKQIEHSTSMVRRKAIRLIVRIAPKRAPTPLLAKVDDPDHAVRKAVAAALATLEPTETVYRALAKLQTDENAEVRRRASMTLTELVDKNHPDRRARIVRQAKALLKEARAALRREGLWTLGQLRETSTFPAAMSLANTDLPVAPSEFDGADLRETRLVAWCIKQCQYHEGGDQAAKWFVQQTDTATQIHAARAIEALQYEAGAAPLAECLKKWESVAGERLFVYGGAARTAGIRALAALESQTARQGMRKLITIINPVDTPENYLMLANALLRAGDKRFVASALGKLPQQNMIESEDTAALRTLARRLGTTFSGPNTVRFNRYRGPLLTPMR